MKTKLLKIMHQTTISQISCINNEREKQRIKEKIKVARNLLTFYYVVSVRMIGLYVDVRPVLLTL